MRLWQKGVLGLLAISALTAVGSTAALIYSGWSATALPTGPQVQAAPPNPSPPASATPRLVAAATRTATPFQPVPWTPTWTPSPTPTATPTATPTPPPTNTPTPSIPDEAYIEGIWGFPQTFNLSCESRSAADLARYFGVNFTELEFLYALPASDNPERGFVGDVRGYLGQLPPAGYGVHAGPVAELMRAFGLPATSHRGMSLEALRAEIAAGRPVMIWAIRDLSYSEPVEYTASDGETTTVARFEHTFIVIGYGSETITVLDNQFVYSVPLDQFARSWAVLGNMAITVDP